MYGLAIKLWSSEFDRESDEFKVVDSVVYLSHDINTQDILYLSTVVNHLVGDESLEEVFRKHCPLVKGEPISWDEPLVKAELPDYCSDDTGDKNEDDNNDNNEYKDFYAGHFLSNGSGGGSDGEQEEHKQELKPSITKDVSNGSGNEPGAAVKKPRKRQWPPMIYYSKPGTCTRCNKTCGNQGALIAHLKGCNPEQLSELPEKTGGRHPRKLNPDGTPRTKGGMKGPQEKRFSCTYCERKFAFQKALEKHELLHQTNPQHNSLAKRKGKS